MRGQNEATDWWVQTPPVLWPVPATESPAVTEGDGDLSGQRVVVAGPAEGMWLYEQRAATKVHRHQGQLSVGVLSEGDWYRQQRDPSYIAVPHPVPTERVWVETEEPHDGDPDPLFSPDQSDLHPANRSRSLVADPARPPVRRPQRVDYARRSVTGARCWVVHRQGVLRGYRSLGEPYRDELGGINFAAQTVDDLNTPRYGTVLWLYAESNWYRWQDTGCTPTGKDIILAETQLIWLE